jgi:hypothetical protein
MKSRCHIFRIANELRIARGEIQSAGDERCRLVERHKLVYDQVRRDLAAKHAECEDYKARVSEDHVYAANM